MAKITTKATFSFYMEMQWITVHRIWSHFPNHIYAWEEKKPLDVAGIEPEPSSSVHRSAVPHTTTSCLEHSIPAGILKPFGQLVKLQDPCFICEVLSCTIVAAKSGYAHRVHRNSQWGNLHQGLHRVLQQKRVDRWRQFCNHQLLPPSYTQIQIYGSVALSPEGPSF